MKCPRCNGELRRSKKDPTYGLCDDCRKKYKWVEEEFDDDLDDDLDDYYDDDDDEDDDDVLIGDDDDLEDSAKTRRRDRAGEKPKKKKRGLKIFLIILAFVIVAGIAAFIFLGGMDKLGLKKDNPDTETVEPENSDNQNDNTSAANDNPEPITNPDEYSSGTYRVGTDIPAGEYVLIADMAAYFERTTDTTGEIDSIIANGNFNTNAIVTLNDGEYFIFTSSTAYPIDKAPTLDTTQQGMFKVGRDIEPGDYTVRSDGEGTVEVRTDSSHSLDSIFSQESITGEKIITVGEGQYLVLTEAYIVQ